MTDCAFVAFGGIELVASIDEPGQVTSKQAELLDASIDLVEPGFEQRGDR